jgi:ribosomal protein S18 acetylase RimI-like enzyme
MNSISAIDEIMITEEQDLCVTMIHEELNSVPEYNLSPKYCIKWYVLGDEEIWTSIQRASDLHNTIDKTLFFREFPKVSFDLKERQCFIYDRFQRVVGTATAWEEIRSPFSGFGLVHWMAVLPEFQHQGIGKMLMGVICRKLIFLGYKQACLRTSTLRPNAIALYKRFGFKIVNIKKWN